MSFVLVTIHVTFCQNKFIFKLRKIILKLRSLLNFVLHLVLQLLLNTRQFFTFSFQIIWVVQEGFSEVYDGLLVFFFHSQVCTLEHCALVWQCLAVVEEQVGALRSNKGVVGYLRKALPIRACLRPKSPQNTSWKSRSRASPKGAHKKAAAACH